MHRHDGPRARCDGSANGFWVKAVRVGIYIGKYRNAPRLENGDSGAVPRVGWHNDFVTKFEAEGLNCRQKCDRPIHEAQTVFGSVQLRKTTGKFVRMLAGYGKAAPVTAFH